MDLRFLACHPLLYVSLLRYNWNNSYQASGQLDGCMEAARTNTEKCLLLIPAVLKLMSSIIFLQKKCYKGGIICTRKDNLLTENGNSRQTILYCTILYCWEILNGLTMIQSLGPREFTQFHFSTSPTHHTNFLDIKVWNMKKYI